MRPLYAKAFSSSFVILLALSPSCKTSRKRSESPDQVKMAALRQKLSDLHVTDDCPEKKVCATFLQLNDIYEIDAVSGGNAGGLDRVATLRQALAENPKSGPVISFLAGDFLNPSGLGTIKEDGKAWAGRPMVSLLKAIGTDFVIFGNHEFDLKYPDLQARMDETVSLEDTSGSCSAAAIQLAPRVAAERSSCERSEYQGGQAPLGCIQWLSSNVSAVATDNGNAVSAFKANGQDIPKARVITLKNGEAHYDVGLLGLTIVKNQKDYLQIADPKTSGQSLISSLKNATFGSQPDCIIAITHLNREDDVNLLKDLPELMLSIGGHDHRNSRDCVEGEKRCITKADANARTVYIHRLVAEPRGEDGQSQSAITSSLLAIDPSIPQDAKIRSLINCWFQKAETVLKADGQGKVGLRDVVADLKGEVFDGTEEAVRNRKGSSFTNFFAKSMFETTVEQLGSSRTVSFALYNSGSIRIDDLIGPGPVSYYELIRILPFGGDLQTGLIKISDLAKLLRRTWKDLDAGSGAILQLYPKIASSDLEADQITEARITQELMTSANAASADDKVFIVGNDYLLKYGDDLSSAEKQYFDLNVEQVASPNLLEALLQGFQKLGSGS